MRAFAARKLIIIVLIIDIMLFGALFYSKPNKQEVSVDLSETRIQRICELATLECFYHNVSLWSKPSNFIGFGGKRLWIEYDGVVRVGVEANQIKVSEPDNDGIITVFIPEAVILDKDLDEESMYEIDSESPLWGFIPLYEAVNTEERKAALDDAQENMVASASQNGMILEEAKGRAKKIIEKNIIALREASGKKYKIKFIDASGAQTVTEMQEPSSTEGA